MQNKTLNVERFIGFADIYEEARPTVPVYPVEIIKKYLDRPPKIVVDLGCGTGLSTLVWKLHCEQVIGIEPSGDMLRVAMEKQDDKVNFIQAFADETGLEEGVADVVICSQSFHWMEPTKTLEEVNRLLREGGIFATIDCDWPPVCNREVELAYNKLFAKIKEIEDQYLRESCIRYDKATHLTNIQTSGYFQYAREIVFINSEPCTAKRFIDIARSQGGLQSVLKNYPELIKEALETFEAKIQQVLGKEDFEVDFCYRMRIGIK